MKLKRKLLFSIFFMLFIFSIPLAYASWYQDNIDGDWSYCTRSEFAYLSGGFSEGSVQWHSDNVSDFQGYIGTINFSLFESQRSSWYALTTYKDVIFDWYFEGNGSSLYIRVGFQHWQNNFGLTSGLCINYAWATDNKTAFDNNLWISTYTEDYDLGTNVKLYVYLNNSKLHAELYNYRSDLSKPEKYELWNNEVNSNWGSQVYVVFGISHYNWGRFHGYYSDVFQAVTELPESASWTEEQGADFWRLINDFKQNVLNFGNRIWQYINQMWSWFYFLYNILAIVWNAVTLSIQFLPFIILFWFLDAIMTSVNEGDLHPIGKVFMTIYTFTASLISAIINILHTIYDVVHFW